MTSTHNEKAMGSDHIIPTPIWMLVIRIFQVFLSLVILGLSADIIHGAYLDTLGFAIATSVITWVVVAYLVLSEKAVQAIYNIIAYLVLDGFMMILWLATFAAVAADRAKYHYDVNVTQCFNDGSDINSETCSKKRDLLKRGVLLFKKGQSEMSAVAGLGALVWLLFIATFVWHMVMFFQARKEGRFQFGSSSSPKENHQMEAQPAAQQQPLMAQPPVHSQPTEYQGAYPPQGQAPYQQPQSPYQQQDSAYPPPQGTYYPPQAPQEQYTQPHPPQEPYSQPYPPQQPLQAEMTGHSYQDHPQHQHGGELAGSEAPSYTGTYENTASPPPPQQHY